MRINMMKPVSILAASIIAIFISGCAAPSEGFALEAAEKRAPFDMECDEVNSQLLGDVVPIRDGLTQMDIGVTGCGKKASYKTTCQRGGFAGEKWHCSPTLNSINK